MTEELPYRHDPEEPEDAPSSPIVEIVLRHKNKQFKCLAVLDTGTAYSTITEAARQALGPRKSGDRPVIGATEDDGDEYPLYKIDELYFGGRAYSQIELTHLQTSTRIMLIGRDILNDHEILLDGPQEKLTLG